MKKLKIEAIEDEQWNYSIQVYRQFLPQLQEILVKWTDDNILIDIDIKECERPI
jgi:hypothetical protein